jgi:hypothetical protein
LRSIIAGMTADLVCALTLFLGNVGHLGVLSYKVLKFTELEVVKVCVHLCMVCVGLCGWVGEWVGGRVGVWVGLLVCMRMCVYECVCVRERERERERERARARVLCVVGDVRERQRPIFLSEGERQGMRKEKKIATVLCSRFSSLGC